jgi:RNA polymerase sigma factor (sigma-70 family)
MIDYLRAANRYSRTKKENNTVQIDAETYDNLIQYLPDERRQNFRLDYDKVNELVGRLTKKQKAVLNFYYYEDWQTLNIGEELNLTVTRIQQIRTEGIQKLRKFLRRDICIEGKERLL